MSGAHRNFEHGPATYTVSAAVTGGQLVMFDSSNVGKVKPAAAGTVASQVVGVALSDANAAGTNPTSPLNVSWAQPDVAVAYSPVDVDLTFASAAAPGDALKCAANGAVTKYVVGTDTDPTLIVAKCTATAAVSNGATGRARLLI